MFTTAQILMLPASMLTLVNLLLLLITLLCIIRAPRDLSLDLATRYMLVATAVEYRGKAYAKEEGTTSFEEENLQDGADNAF